MRTNSESGDALLVKQGHSAGCLRQQSTCSACSACSNCSSPDHVFHSREPPLVVQKNSKSVLSSPPCVAALCVLCLVLTIGTVVLAVIILQTFSKAAPNPEPYCLPCRRVKLPESKDADIRIVKTSQMRDGEIVEVCCTKDASSFEKLLDQYLDVPPKEHKSSEHDRPTEKGASAPQVAGVRVLPGTVVRPGIVAHLVLNRKRATFPDSKDGLYPIEGWAQPGEQPDVVKRQVRVRDGRIEVERPGLYYVYSQMHFLEKPSNHSHAYRAHSLSHYIYKYNRNLPNGGEVRLLQNARSRCQGERGYLQHTSYLGAVFRFQAGDQVFVKVNNLTSVFNDHTSTYFGLYMIDT